MELLIDIPLLLTLPSGNFVATIVVSTLAFFIAAQFLEGVQMKSLMTAGFVAIMVAILNAALVEYLATDYGISITGLLTFVTTAVVILLASAVLTGFKVKGLKWALILAVVVSLLNGFLFKLLEQLLNR